MTGTHPCPVCGKETEDYCVGERGKRKVTYCSKGCGNRCRSRLWRQANPEKAKECNRKYYQANLEKKREYNRKYYQANLEKAKEYSRKWKKANPEKRRESRRRRYQAIPEKKRERAVLAGIYKTCKTQCPEQLRKDIALVHLGRRIAGKTNALPISRDKIHEILKRIEKGETYAAYE